jgi:hypothetical protein
MGLESAKILVETNELSVHMQDPISLRVILR